VAKPAEITWPFAVQLDAPNGLEPQAPPAAPAYEPETQDVMRPNYAKKKSRKVWGLTLATIGVGTSAYGYSQASSAIANTPPGSAERSMAFNMWAGGIGVAALGSWVTTRGVFKDYPHKVAEPDEGAIQRNAKAREAHARAVADVREQNEKQKESIVMKISGGRGR
jgi:hypothetical protein